MKREVLLPDWCIRRAGGAHTLHEDVSFEQLCHAESPEGSKTHRAYKGSNEQRSKRNMGLKSRGEARHMRKQILEAGFICRPFVFGHPLFREKVAHFCVPGKFRHTMRKSCLVLPIRKVLHEDTQRGR